MDEYSPSSSSVDSTPNSSDVDSGMNSERFEGEQDGVREQFRIAKRKRYLSGQSRPPLYSLGCVVAMHLP